MMVGRGAAKSSGHSQPFFPKASYLVLNGSGANIEEAGCKRVLGNGSVSLKLILQPTCACGESVWL